MATRILIIASYNGGRHPTTLSPAALLDLQYRQLSNLNHNLDAIVVVENEARRDKPYEEALFRFNQPIELNHAELSILSRSNDQGSYGAWKDGFLAFPNYDWYFFLEDDYVFFIDDFDQQWIDLWTPDTTYSAMKVGTDHNFPLHASISNGLTKGEILKKIDWCPFVAQVEYDWHLQVGWSQLFGTGLRDIREHYSVPFWTGNEVIEHGTSGKPILIGPVQALKELMPREISEDRHRIRLMEDPVYKQHYA